MRPIGGFFDLESATQGEPFHRDAAPLSTGRSCMHLWAREESPEHCYVPFYSCNALFQPLVDCGIPFSFYGINEHLLPVGLPKSPRGSDWLVWTNFFGICRPGLDDLQRQWGRRILVDNTHSFFDAKVFGCWSFTSARKYFGVPDGAYCYSPDGNYDVGSVPRFRPTKLRHLFTRVSGDHPDPLSLFREAESTLGKGLEGMSWISESILRCVDYRFARRRRLENFRYLQRRLGPMNKLTVPDASDSLAPFCYPFLPTQVIDRSGLAQKQIFIPRLWADTFSRRDSGYLWERDLTERLLPLPIDHRYCSSDMGRLVTAIEECIN